MAEAAAEAPEAADEAPEAGAEVSEDAEPAPVAEANGTTEEEGEHQEGESVQERPDSPDDVDEAAGDEAAGDESSSDDAETGESEQS